MANVLITGAAGFIGFHLVRALTQVGDSIVALDNFQENHDFQIRLHRVKKLNISPEKILNNGFDEGENINFLKLEMLDKKALGDVFNKYRPDIVIHLAAQTGVRQSASHPQMYFENNIYAFNNLLECCKTNGIKRLIYASSSSVYGMNNQKPSRETDSTDIPTSIYAVTKKTGELLVSAYTAQSNMLSVGLRFFTVYGPWCRTDMAAYIFMKALTEGKVINLFNDGEMLRDFTYIDDVVSSIVLIRQRILSEGPDSTFHEIFNVGNTNAVTLFEYLSLIEKFLSQKAIYNYQPMQDGEVKSSNADIRKIQQFVGYEPKWDLSSGIKEMAAWFVDYCNEYL